MGFELMAYRFVVLFPSAVGEQFVERNYKIVLDFIVYFDRNSSQYGGVPLNFKAHLRQNQHSFFFFLVHCSLYVSTCLW